MRSCNSEALSCPSAARDSSSPPSPRLTHIDALRGLLLILMGVNHIQSDLRIVTDHALGFVSAAEGFVFLAGLMAGYVYARTWRKTNLHEMTRRCTRRAVTIYRWHIVAYLAVFIGLVCHGFSYGAFPVNAPASFLAHPQLSFLAGVLLLNQPPLFDILPMYCVFLLATPACLRVCQRGHYATLIGVSFGFWLFVNLFLSQNSFEHGPIHAGAFNLAAWQLLFIAGLCFGHVWASRAPVGASSAASRYLLPAPSRIALSALVAFAAVLFCLRRGFLDIGLPAAVLDVLANKNNLAPLRLLNAGLLFYLTYLLLSRFPALFTWRPLAWLGRCSLTVFTTHILATYVIQAFPATFADTASGRWLGTALMLASLFAGAAVHTVFTKTSRRKTAPARAHVPTPVRTRHALPRRAHVPHEQPAFGPADPVHNRG